MDLAHYQDRIVVWLTRVFGASVAQSRAENATRLVEEAVELAQAEGVPSDVLARVLKRCCSRPVGEPGQEAAGVAFCLLAYTKSAGLDLDHELGKEIAQVEQTRDYDIRERHAAKIALGIAMPTTHRIDPFDSDTWDGPPKSIVLPMCKTPFPKPNLIEQPGEELNPNVCRKCHKLNQADTRDGTELCWCPD
jgi:hypothetical protein